MSGENYMETLKEMNMAVINTQLMHVISEVK